MEKGVYIYKITNKINKKCYIGQTSRYHRIGNDLVDTNPINRFKQHILCSKSKRYSCPKLHRAISVWGEKNFDFKVLKLCKDQEEGDLEEIRYIKLYNSIKKGYNISSGGQYSSNRISDDTKKLISEKNSLLYKNSNIRNKLSYDRKTINKDLPPNLYKVFSRRDGRLIGYRVCIKINGKYYRPQFANPDNDIEQNYTLACNYLKEIKEKNGIT